MKMRHQVTGWITAIALTATLVGCQTMRDNPKTAGAIIGGLAGAGAGMLISDDNTKGAVIGGIAGAAVGAGVGYLYERHQQRYDQIEGLEVQVANLEAEKAAQLRIAEADRQNAIILSLPDEILFEQGSSALTQGATTKMNEVAYAMNEIPDSRIQVIGYASSEGDDAANVSLSQRRADVIKNQLALAGVNPGRITAVGMGASAPIASNATEAGRVQNRRAEIIVIPTR